MGFEITPRNLNLLTRELEFPVFVSKGQELSEAKLYLLTVLIGHGMVPYDLMATGITNTIRNMPMAKTRRISSTICIADCARASYDTPDMRRCAR